METQFSQTHGFSQSSAVFHHGSAVTNHEGAQYRGIDCEGIFQMDLDGEGKVAADHWDAAPEIHCDRSLYGRDCEAPGDTNSTEAEPISIATQSAILAVNLDEAAQGEGTMNIAELSKELERIYETLMREGSALGITDIVILALHIINNGPQPTTEKGRALMEKIVHDGAFHNAHFRGL